jgi:hypothetical protein
VSATLRATIRAALAADFPTCASDRFEAIVERVAEAVEARLHGSPDRLRAERDQALRELNEMQAHAKNILTAAMDYAAERALEEGKEEGC